ncbi:hypothetical protein CAEBREN_07067 [Caenorhabditis brenneri]|uniref:Uncharacterized protein n=1 Tax=Caenorhabditis brenneri TaxID=135651 RepID=G0M7E7_CAEBE|nr:hypothetical protein CAEBREN_07067 [Caenorhabditis brenneri]
MSKPSTSAVKLEDTGFNLYDFVEATNNSLRVENQKLTEDLTNASSKIQNYEAKVQSQSVEIEQLKAANRRLQEQYNNIDIPFGVDRGGRHFEIVETLREKEYRLYIQMMMNENSELQKELTKKDGQIKSLTSELEQNIELQMQQEKIIVNIRDEMHINRNSAYYNKCNAERAYMEIDLLDKATERLRRQLESSQSKNRRRKNRRANKLASHGNEEEMEQDDGNQERIERAQFRDFYIPDKSINFVKF